MPETPKRIHLLGDGRHEEAVGSGTITPGMLLALNSAGQVAVHATAGGEAERAFALEDALQGHTIDDDYASGDVVGFVLAGRGDVVYGWLAFGESVSKGDLLSSNGVGALRKVTGTDKALGVALEALDLNDSGDVATRIKVRIL